jgi:hypothetical protein
VQNGRFLSADWSSTPSPVPYANLTNPQTLNLYAMVSDNPESFTDLDGHKLELQSNTVACATGGSESCDAQQAAAQNSGTAENQAPQNLAAQVPPAAKAAIMDSINASNAHTADDKKGGSHEEGGMWGTTTDTKPFVAPAVPGAMPKPGENPHIDPGKSVKPVPSDSVKSVGGFWHVHPGRGGGAGFVQPPSAVDIKAATAPINIVIGAGNKQVYFYNSSGVIGSPMSLKDFMKEPPQ